MKLIYHDDSMPRTYEQVYRYCREGYGIKRPDKVSGFQSFFYRLPDVYAIGMAEKWMDNNDEIKGEFREFIRRFMAEDYGFVTRDEKSINDENRWMCGSCRGSIGRYSFSDKSLYHYGGVVLEFFKDYGIIYSIEEDISEIYREQYNDPGYEHGIRYVSQ